MKNFSDKKLSTLIQHLGEDKSSGAPVVPPIVQTSLFVYDTIEELNGQQQNEHERERFTYSRCGNPTLDILEQKLAAIEGSDRCRVFGSGMAAISAAILSCLKNDKRHVVAVDTCYGPTRQFLTEYISEKFGVETTIVDGRFVENVFGALRPDTCCVYLESPGSILFRLQDLSAITAVCKERGIRTICDNSYSAGIFQKPIHHGVDLVVHSGTKYLAGHSDLTAGVMCGSHEILDGISRMEYPLLGAALAPFPAWLMLRGLRTLQIRLDAHQKAGNIVARELQSREWAKEVNHIGLSDYPQAELRDRQMSGSGGLLSFIPQNRDLQWCARFINALDIYQKGVSWGGFESLAVLIDMKPLDWETSRPVVRLYLGLEDVGDLVADLDQAARVADSQ